MWILSRNIVYGCTFNVILKSRIRYFRIGWTNDLVRAHLLDASRIYLTGRCGDTRRKPISSSDSFSIEMAMNSTSEE